MVKVRQDLTGMMFGNLLVLEQAEDHVPPCGVHRAKWRCQCTCGNITEVCDADLKKGNIKSCGCQNPAKAKENRYQLNLVDEHGSYGIGYTSNTNEPFYFDMDDYDKIKPHCWSIKHQRENLIIVFARIKGENRESSMASYISPGYTVHIDHNPFNNRKYNLMAFDGTPAYQNVNTQMHLCEQYGLNPTLLNSSGNDIIKSRRRGNLK